MGQSFVEAGRDGDAGVADAGEQGEDLGGMAPTTMASG
jgi:hypothetical protein